MNEKFFQKFMKVFSLLAEQDDADAVQFAIITDDILQGFIGFEETMSNENGDVNASIRLALAYLENELQKEGTE